MLLSDYGRHVLLPEKDFADFKRPAPTFPRSPGHHAEWIHACKTGQADDPPISSTPAGSPRPTTWATSPIRAGKKLEWDAENLRCTNAPEADPFIRRDYRKGWEL